MNPGTANGIIDYAKGLRTTPPIATLMLIQESRKQAGLPYEARTLKKDCYLANLARRLDTTVEGLVKMNLGLSPHSFERPNGGVRALPAGTQLFVPKTIASEFGAPAIKETFE